MDGKLLALARKEKENILQQALRTDRRRHDEVYARVPELRRVDERIAALVPQAAAAMGGGRSIDQLRAEGLELQARRAELLVENGWPMDYLDGAWDCPKCRDTGYVHGEMCSCLEKLYEKAQAKDLSALLKLGNESFSMFSLEHYDPTFIPALKGSIREQMEVVYDICYNYAVNFKGKHSNNLLLYGNTGLGKTFLSACIAREVARQGFSVVYETAVAALAAFESQRFSRSEEESAQANAQVRRMVGCDLLILDDLGTEMVTEFSRSALYTLINSRLVGRKKTIVSTNLIPEELEKRYTPQIASRLLGEYQPVHFLGQDIRREDKD